MAICFWDFLGVTVIRSGVTPRDDSRSFTAALKTRHNFQLSIPSYVFKMILVVFEIYWDIRRFLVAFPEPCLSQFLISLGGNIL